MKDHEENTMYKVSVCKKEGVPDFAPKLPNPPIFKKNDQFRQFLLSKGLLTPSFHLFYSSIIHHHSSISKFEQL